MPQTQTPGASEPTVTPAWAFIVLGMLILASGVASLNLQEERLRRGRDLGDDRAYSSGVVAILLGAVLVFVFLARREAEPELLLRDYEAQETLGSQAPGQSPVR